MKRLALLTWLAGCADMLAPDVVAPLHAACSDTVRDPDRDVRFADVSAIIEEYHCADCHTPGGKTPIGLEVGGLDVTSLETLRRGGARSGANIVLAGKPCESVLLQKVSPGPPFGARMPVDGPEYLDDEDLALISDWIAQGAHD